MPTSCCPSSVIEPVGYLLPALEVVIGLALVLGVMTRGAALISGLLFVAFIIGIASVWARGIEIDCGCFGGGGARPRRDVQVPVGDRPRRRTPAPVRVPGLVRPRTRLALDSVLFRHRTLQELDAELDETWKTMSKTTWEGA